MSKTVGLFALTLAIVMGVIGTQALSAQREPVKSTALLKADLAGIEGKEGNVTMVELAPGAATGRHYHPGHDFIYVLAGSGTFEAEGKEPVTIKPAGIFHVTPKQVHNLKNTSKTAPLKVLVFSIYDKGQPPVTPVK